MARVSEYLSLASLTVDEASLARNVLDRNAAELFQRLDYGQVAPIGFLLAVKACSLVFGTSEWSLRLVPFVCGLAALPLFWLVARRIVGEPAAAAATALFALATPLALWSTILKQYSSDVLCGLVVIAVAQWTLSCRLVRRDIVLAIVAGGCTAVFSHAALFVLAVSGAVLVADAIHRRSNAIVSRILIVAGWGAVMVPVLLWSRHIMRPVDYSYMQKFWEPLFMPTDFTAAGAWLWDRFVSTFVDSPWPNAALMYSRPKLWALLFACGVLALLKDRPRQALLLTGPILLAMVASAMKQYPLGGRVGLFLVPFLLLLVVAGAQKIGSLGGRRVGALAPIVLVPFAVAALAKFPPSFKTEHLRPSLEYLSTRLQPGDVIWVYYGAAPAFKYYARRIPIQADIVFGECDRTDPRANLRQIDTVRGRHRVWVVLAHIVTEERLTLVQYLDSIGTLQETHSSTPHDHSAATSTVYRYKLDDVERLDAASAADFPAPPIDDPSAWSCFGPMSRSPDGDHAAIAALEHERD